MSLQEASVTGLLETLLAVVGSQLDEETKDRLAVAFVGTALFVLWNRRRLAA